jgi:predicted secreted protein
VSLSRTNQNLAQNFVEDRSDCRRVSVDQPFFIHLWEDRTRGEQWVPSYHAKGLALLSDEFLRIASNNAVENGQRIFEFKAVQPGVYELVFEKRMGWKFTAEDRRVFRIEAAPSSRN